MNEIDGSLQKLLILNQKCYNVDNPEDNWDMIHMCPPWFTGDTKKCTFCDETWNFIGFYKL